MAALTAPVPTLRSFSYWAFRYRRSWRRSLVPILVGPCLYLLIMGVVMGSLITERNPGAADRFGGMTYLAFVAPAIVAVAAMLGATTEAGFPVYSAIHTTRSYTAMLATPLAIRDVVLGHLAWATVRIGAISAVLVALIVALGASSTPLVLLLVPAGMLTGLAFAAALMAFAATVTHQSSLMGWQRFGATPMLLFSGVLYPVAQLPPAVRIVVELTPLWHGVDLCRELATGTATIGSASIHVAYLAALTAIGIAVSFTAFARQLADR